MIITNTHTRTHTQNSSRPSPLKPCQILQNLGQAILRPSVGCLCGPDLGFIFALIRLYFRLPRFRMQTGLLRGMETAGLHLVEMFVYIAALLVWGRNCWFVPVRDVRLYSCMASLGTKLLVVPVRNVLLYSFGASLGTILLDCTCSRCSFI